MSKMDPQMETHFRTHFGHLAPLCCPRQALGAKMTPKASQESPGPVQASIFTDFRWIWVDFAMIFRVMWATFC